MRSARDGGQPGGSGAVEPLNGADAAAGVALGVPPCMIRTAISTLPMRVGFGCGSTAKRVTLRKAAGFGIAPFLFLYFGKQETKPTLVQSFALGDLDLVTSFASQSGVEGDPGQKHSAFKIGRIARSETLSCLGASQLVRLQGESESRELRMWCSFPSVGDT